MDKGLLPYIYGGFSNTFHSIFWGKKRKMRKIIGKRTRQLKASININFKVSSRLIGLRNLFKVSANEFTSLVLPTPFKNLINVLFPKTINAFF